MYLTREWRLVAVVALFAAAALALYYATSPTRLTLAVGPLDSPEGRLMSAFADVLEEQRSSIRLRIVGTDGLKSSAEALRDDRVDLAVARTDVMLPPKSLSLAILREEPLLLITPESSKIEDVTGLEKKRIGLFVRHEADTAFLASILGYCDVRPEAVTIVQLTEAEIVPALVEKKVDAVAFVAVPTSGRVRGIMRSLEAAFGGKLRVLPISQAASIAEQNPALTPVDIKEGALSGRPILPPEDTKSLGVSYRLISRTELGRATAAEIVQALFQKRQRLALSTPAANELKAFDTDTATGASLPIHPGAVDYFAREQATFMERYGDLLWLAVFSMGGISSGIAWLTQRFRRKRRQMIDVLLDRLMKILDEARQKKTVGELDALAIDLDRLVSLAIRYARNRTTDSRAMGALLLGIDSARAAIADNRRKFLDEASGNANEPVESSRSLSRFAQFGRSA